MSYKYIKIDKDDWKPKPLTKEQKRSYIARFIIVGITLIFLFLSYYFFKELGYNHRESLHLSVRISTGVILLSWFLQFCGVPIYYPADKTKKPKKVMLSQGLMNLAWFLHITTFMAIVNPTPYKKAIILIVCAIQVSMILYAKILYANSTEDEKLTYKNFNLYFWLMLITIASQIFWNVIYNSI